MPLRNAQFLYNIWKSGFPASWNLHCLLACELACSLLLTYFYWHSAVFWCSARCHRNCATLLVRNCVASAVCTYTCICNVGGLNKQSKIGALLLRNISVVYYRVKLLPCKVATFFCKLRDHHYPTAHLYQRWHAILPTIISDQNY